MRIVQKMQPSRDDAVRITRNEKVGMIVLAYAATVLDDLQTEMKDRLRMIENGPERIAELAARTDELLNELRATIPMNQRLNLQNTAKDYDMRLSPKMTPTRTSVVMQKEEFKELVDHARARCRECTDDDEECEKCRLFQLLTVILPLDDYHHQLLCPYNMGEWGN